MEENACLVGVFAHWVSFCFFISASGYRGWWVCLWNDGISWLGRIKLVILFKFPTCPRSNPSAISPTDGHLSVSTGLWQDKDAIWQADHFVGWQASYKIKFLILNAVLALASETTAESLSLGKFKYNCRAFSALDEMLPVPASSSSLTHNGFCTLNSLFVLSPIS